MTLQAAEARGVAPKRIQRQRTKGWRMPEGAVYVGRPTWYGNDLRADMPDVYGQPLGRRRAAELYGLAFERALDDSGPENEAMLRDRLDAIRGKDLACWCPLDEPCHADWLLKWANR